MWSDPARPAGPSAADASPTAPGPAAPAESAKPPAPAGPAKSAKPPAPAGPARPSCRARPALRWAAAAGFWLAVWQLGALAVGQSLLLPGPAETLCQLLRLLASGGFWARAGFTALRVLSGLALGCCAGALLALLAARSGAARTLLAVPVQLLKAAPVASFIILALLWVRSRWLSLLISFVMGLPILYTALLEGLLQADRQLVEMARVFRLRPWAAVRAVWLPQLLPYAAQAFRLALGLCWKSGVAAEIIALPQGSIGEAFYAAKLTFATGELFAWTAAVLLLSALCERLLLALLGAAVRRVCGAPLAAPAPAEGRKGVGTP